MDLNDLLTKGYFPEELIPPFTTEDLAIVRNDIITSINIYDPIAGTAKRQITKMIHFSVPKIKAYRRALGIPHPLHFTRLSHTIINNWADIVRHCNGSDISLSTLRTRAGSSRAVLKPNFKNTTREKIIRSTGNRYVLKIDIAKFYSSIYTHSIPWSLHTKPVAKANRNRTRYYGNALDEDCRKMQDGQTIGLPIGPDTSRIISEIILSSIDQEIKAELGYLNGVRVVDDYHLYFRSYGELEKGRAIASRTLKGFELELNQSKEQLLELPEIIESEWFAEIREFKFRNRWDYQRKDLVTFFDTVINYARKYPGDIVMTYAISKMRFTVFSLKNWAILQSLLMNALLIEPKVLPYIAQNLLSYQLKGHRVNEAVVTGALVQLIEYHLDLRNDFEVAWSLWIAKSLGLILPTALAPKLSLIENPIIVLVALDLHESGLLPGLDKTYWTTLLTTANLYNEHWLIAYEAYRLGWLTTPTDHVNLDPFFKLLKDHNVAFYKTNRTLDLSKVKVTHSPEYFEQENDIDDEDTEEGDSVFTGITPRPPTQEDVLPDEDLPF